MIIRPGVGVAELELEKEVLSAVVGAIRAG